MIPYGRQSIDEDDVAAVVEALRSDWLTQGPACAHFEEAVAKYCDAPHAVATCNATAALHLACLALKIGPGDLVWTSPITFVASANCALYCGANIDFVDIDTETFNISVPALQRKLADSGRDGRLPKALIVVHIAGTPCDMKEISALCRSYGIAVVEDASHALGSIYCDTKIGACQFSDLTIFSFHPVKMITTAEGGMVLTRDEHLADQMRCLRSHGIVRAPNLLSRPADGEWYYEQVALGYNYRLSDLHAALGLSQIRKLEHFVERRQTIAERYRKAFVRLPLTVQHVEQDRRSSYHLFIVRISSELGIDARSRVFHQLRSRGIAAQVHYIPVHTQPFFSNRGFSAKDFPASIAYYRECLSLPIFPELDCEAQDHVICSVSQALTG